MRSEEGEESEEYSSDLLCGITPQHIRRLCENPWNGGFGYHPNQVGDMTIDEIFMVLCDHNNLRSKGRSITLSTSAGMQDDEGYVKGQAWDKDIQSFVSTRRKFLGKSKAQMIRERSNNGT